MVNSADEGSALFYCEAVIRNCIEWGNSSNDWPAKTLNTATTSFSGQDEFSPEGAEFNLRYPGFVDPEAGDYHLTAESIFVDAGTNYYWFVWPQRDLDGNCRLVGPRVDLGCYEYGASPDADGDLLSDSDESAMGTEPEREDTDGDGLRDGLEILRESNPLALTQPGIVRVPSEASTIQEALCLAVNGDEIVVMPGTYLENLHFCGVDVVLRSQNPWSRDRVLSTVIDGRQKGPVVSFMGTESPACVLAGFTIQNGKGYFCGGIQGGTSALRAHATIENNVITQNYSEETRGDGIIYCDGVIRYNTITENLGGGLAYCSGTILRNVISGNSDGGLWYCHGTIQNNTVQANRGGYGAGLNDCDGPILNNKISGNMARCDGGGLYRCDGLIAGNAITGNSAKGYDHNNGGGLSECNGVIESNVISRNSASGSGGGLHDCKGTIRNSTICHNSADWMGGGLDGCSGPIRNCIIWGNAAPSTSQLDPSWSVSYSCVQDWTGGGNNITADPSFVAVGHWDDSRTPDDPWDDVWIKGDYHLRPDSPCIDAGDNSLLDRAGLDMDGNLRIAFGRTSLTVDMGAYEYDSRPFGVTEIIKTYGGRLQLFWNSQPNDSYVVWSCTDLSTGEWIEEGTVASEGAITWWDDPAANGAQKFCRIGIK